MGDRIMCSGASWWWYLQLHPDQLVPVLLQQQLQQWGLSSGLPDWGRKDT